MNSNQGFTLIELLIVIGIVAILATTVVLVLNPAEFMKKSRDTTRLSDITTLNKAISLYQTDGGTSFGFSNTVYVSIPDTSATCANLGLPSLPDGWAYACVNSSYYRDVDGTGWVPIDLSSVSYGKILNILPIDPTNATSSGSYYTYVTGSWKLTAMLESEKYASQMNMDGGSDPALFEAGSDMDLANFQRGLTGYWKFDDGSGDTAIDTSGNSNSGTLINSPIWISGKIKGGLDFNGASERVRASSIALNANNFSVFAWVYKKGDTNTYVPLVEQGGSSKFRLIYYRGSNRLCFGKDSVTDNFYCAYNAIANNDQWYFVGGVVEGGVAKIYLDGVNLSYTQTPGNYGATGENYLFIGDRDYTSLVDAWNGTIDEVRVYNRTLSGSEIKAMYDATK